MNDAAMRILGLDIWRGMLMVLVVAGHVAGMAARLVPPEEYGTYAFIFKIIYAFHMPAFFVLAGLLMAMSASEGKTPWSDFVWKKARRLLLPYFCFGVLNIVVYHVAIPCFYKIFASSSNGYYLHDTMRWWHPWASLFYGAPWPGTDGFRCNSALWFLPCLFSASLLGGATMRFANCISRKFILSPVAILVPVWCVACVAGFLGHDVGVQFPMGINALLWQFQFFVLGMVTGILFKRFGRPARVFRCSIFALSAVLFVYCICAVGNIYYGRSQPGEYLMIVMLGCSGSLVSLEASNFLGAKRGWLVNWLCDIGKESITIMMTHKYPVLIAFAAVVCVKRILPISGIVALASYFVVTAFGVAGSYALAAAIRTAVRRVGK